MSIQKLINQNNIIQELQMGTTPSANQQTYKNTLETKASTVLTQSKIDNIKQHILTINTTQSHYNNWTRQLRSYLNQFSSVKNIKAEQFKDIFLLPNFHSFTPQVQHSRDEKGIAILQFQKGLSPLRDVITTNSNTNNPFTTQPLWNLLFTLCDNIVKFQNNLPEIDLTSDLLYVNKQLSRIRLCTPFSSIYRLDQSSQTGQKEEERFHLLSNQMKLLNSSLKVGIIMAQCMLLDQSISGQNFRTLPIDKILKIQYYPFKLKLITIGMLQSSKAFRFTSKQIVQLLSPYHIKIKEMKKFHTHKTDFQMIFGNKIKEIQPLVDKIKGQHKQNVHQNGLSYVKTLQNQNYSKEIHYFNFEQQKVKQQKQIQTVKKQIDQSKTIKKEIKKQIKSPMILPMNMVPSVYQYSPVYTVKLQANYSPTILQNRNYPTTPIRNYPTSAESYIYPSFMTENKSKSPEKLFSTEHKSKLFQQTMSSRKPFPLEDNDSPVSNQGTSSPKFPPLPTRRSLQPMMPLKIPEFKGGSTSQNELYTPIQILKLANLSPKKTPFINKSVKIQQERIRESQQSQVSQISLSHNSHYSHVPKMEEQSFNYSKSAQISVSARSFGTEKQQYPVKEDYILTPASKVDVSQSHHSQSPKVYQQTSQKQKCDLFEPFSQQEKLKKLQQQQSLVDDIMNFTQLVNKQEQIQRLSRKIQKEKEQVSQSQSKEINNQGEEEKQEISEYGDQMVTSPCQTILFSKTGRLDIDSLTPADQTANKNSPFIKIQQNSDSKEFKQNQRCDQKLEHRQSIQSQVADYKGHLEDIQHGQTFNASVIERRQIQQRNQSQIRQYQDLQDSLENQSNEETPEKLKQIQIASPDIIAPSPPHAATVKRNSSNNFQIPNKSKEWSQKIRRNPSFSREAQYLNFVQRQIPQKLKQTLQQSIKIHQHQSRKKVNVSTIKTIEQKLKQIQQSFPSRREQQ